MKYLLTTGLLMSVTQLVSANPGACGGPGQPICTVSEPGMLSLVAAGFVATVVIRRFMKKKV